jgi:hypothetical protein
MRFCPAVVSHGWEQSHLKQNGGFYPASVTNSGAGGPRVWAREDLSLDRDYVG